MPSLLTPPLDPCPQPSHSLREGVLGINAALARRRDVLRALRRTNAARGVEAERQSASLPVFRARLQTALRNADRSCAAKASACVQQYAIYSRSGLAAQQHGAPLSWRQSAHGCAVTIASTALAATPASQRRQAAAHGVPGGCIG